MLETLLANAGSLVIEEDILARLYRGARSVESQIVKVCVSRLRRKLPDAPFKIRSRYGIGYMLVRKDG